MKHTYIALAALASLPTFAGQSQLCNAAAPAATTIVPAPKEACPLSWELGVGYNFASRDLAKSIDGLSVDTLNVDLTAVWELNANNALTLRFGYATGSDDISEAESDIDYYTYDRARARVNNFYLMPGYRYTMPVTETVSLFAGANIGLANSSIKAKDEWNYSTYGVDDAGIEHFHGSDWGFAYSAEVGVRYAISSTVDVFAAYQFFGSTARPKIGIGDGEHVSSRHQISHGVRVGVGCKF